jgi:hypothetical protein
MDKESRTIKFALWLANSRFGSLMFSSPRRVHIVILCFLLFTQSFYWVTAWWSPWPYLVFMGIGVWFGQGLLKPWALIISQAIEPDYDSSLLKLAVPFVVINYVAVFACLFMFGSVVDGNGHQISGTWSHFYFSAVTLTTLGYGNITPLGMFAEVVATIEAILGFMGFAIMAGIVGSIAIKRAELDKNA